MPCSPLCRALICPLTPSHNWLRLLDKLLSAPLSAVADAEASRCACSFADSLRQLIALARLSVRLAGA